MSRNLYDPSNDSLTPLAGYQSVDSALSDTSGNPVMNRTVKAALDTKADASAVASQIQTLTNEVSNKHNVATLQVTTNGWTADTTSQSGTTLHKKSIALNHVYVDSPSVDIGSTGVLPTTSQQDAYNLLQYVTCDSAIPCLYLYALDIPTNAFYINVEGVD